MRLSSYATAPAEVEPGIEERTRAIARQIKGDLEYSDADGQLLGIVGSSTTAPLNPSMAPDFTLRSLAGFDLEATFRKQGMDALKFQFRYKGGTWQSAGFLLNSPGTFAVSPSTPGTAEQIEVRAIFMLKNDETGVYSDAKPAFIAP